jgi:hypothetical protein
MGSWLTRRAFVTALGGSAAVAPLRAARVQLDRAAEERAHRLLAAYDAQGVHRTGTEVDRSSAAWLRGEVAEAGGRARLDGFELERLDVREASVQVGERRVEALPLFDASGTEASGISAAIGPEGIHIVTADRQAIGTEGEFLRDVRTDARTRAVVVVTDSDVPGLVPSNARRFSAPYGCPVVQVAGDTRPVLDEARRAGRQVRVVSHGVRTRVTAFNVVADVEGRDAALAPVVVITPRSGWWTCASERGGGIACWLEAIRAAAARRPARRVIALASSGHELGHLGLEAFLHANAALVRGAHAWIHLGANIGAGAPGATPVGVRLQSSSDELEQAMAASLARAAAPIADRLPRGRVPAGEARNLHVGGARYVSLIGQGNRWFHHADDRYPASVTASSVARCATAVADVVIGLARA